ncbi:ABC transporter ATP-binding protein [Salinarimonas rosea]|uniref:ABC transporter ATP-binding protein n=1 Tax=Salinarimonas rosea TaxID=552063 RepID=UPI00048C8554|nr:ABC transporter ATP-binding protein [Salinarimonas rosea]
MIRQYKKLLWLLDAREKRRGAALLVLMLVAAAAEVIGVAAVPAFVGLVVDPERMQRIPVVADAAAMLGIETTTDLVIWGGLALAAVFALKTALLIGNFYLQMRYVAGRQVSLARRLTDAYLGAPYTFHLHRNSSEIVRNVNREVSVVSGQIIAATLELCTRVVILIAVLGFLFVVEPWITLYWILFFGVIGGAGVAFGSERLRRYGEREQTEGRRVLKAITQSFGGIKEVRVLGREGYFSRQVASAVTTIAQVLRYRQLAMKVIGPVIELGAIVGLLALVAWLVLAGTPTDEVLVTLSLFVVGLVRLREALTAAMSHLAGLRYNLVSVDPIYRDLRELEHDRYATVGKAGAKPTPLRDAIELRGVSYRYQDTDSWALKDVDVSIPRGSAVGFVGSTGAGKSTLVDTLLALVEPEEGGVYVDGVDIRESGVRAWQRAVGYVPQSIYLLDDTIRANIAFGIPEDEVDEVAVQRAVRIAQLERFVERQPQGLETRVGERGVRLSGGERQRIGIARALYQDPQVLVFDEATSALDNSTERAIIGSVEALRGERTVIMIAHRLSTLRNCDTLYFLKAGRIEASGGYDELQDRHSDFRVMAATG